jgi:hypothetical protein
LLLTELNNNKNIPLNTGITYIYFYINAYTC